MSGNKNENNRGRVDVSKYGRAFSAIVLATFFIASCAPPTQAIISPQAIPSPTPSEGPMGPETIPLQSPVIICPAPDPNHPFGVAMMIFTKGQGGNGSSIEMELQRYQGTNATRPELDGGLKPSSSQVRTGLDGVLIPYARVGDKIVSVDLGSCIVEKIDQKTLQQFFKDFKPDDFKKPDQIGFNGKPAKYTASIDNPRGRNINPYRGQIHFPQPQHGSFLRQGRKG